MPDPICSPTPIAVLGAGAWGTALAAHLARHDHPVRLWAHERSQVDEINTAHRNSPYLPDQRLPDSIACSQDYQQTLSGVRDILIAVPSTVFRATLLAIKPLLETKQRLVWATKGLDDIEGQLLDQVVKDILGDIDHAVLSGPSFAREVASGLPTAVTIAANQQLFADDLRDRFQHRNFRVELTRDIVGVELGGAIKNVLAIAIGIIEGLGLGANARAALMVEGLAEMVVLGLALGAEQGTFLGLSGLGDLILTCTDNQSRNRRLGLALGKGQTLAQSKNILGTTEGVVTARNLFHLAQRHNIKMPICEKVYRILYERQAPDVFLWN